MTDTVSAVDHFTDRHRWGDMTTWRRDALELHDRGSIHRIESAGFDPFWAVIGHAHVLAVERRPAVFTNAPQPVLASRKTIAAQPFALRTLVHLDAPDHPKYRKLTADWFRPASLNRLTARLDELSERAVRRLEAAGGTCDFAVDIALPFPLEVILEILGLPEQDFPIMLRLTQEWLGNEDPDLRRASTTSDHFGQALRDIMKYFTVFTAVRQANPTDDLASLIANGVIDGEPLSTMDRLSYYLIIATAGHDTTSYALAEAMGALLEHPEQEMRSLFGHLVPRLRSVELAGVPAHSKTTTVGGIKRLPIRYEITPAASASQEIRREIMCRIVSLSSPGPAMALVG